MTPPTHGMTGMKVDPNCPVRSTPVRGGGKASTSRPGEFAAQISGPSPAAGVSGSAPINAVGAVLALQETPDATSGRAKALMRGDQLLDLLDEIRLGLLTGSIPKDTLVEITDLLKEKREDLQDPRLVEVLDEIDLRTQVELAKLAVTV